MYFQKRHELSKIAEHLHHRMLISQGAKPQKAATNFYPPTPTFLTTVQLVPLKLEIH